MGVNPKPPWPKINVGYFDKAGNLINKNTEPLEMRADKANVEDVLMSMGIEPKDELRKLMQRRIRETNRFGNEFTQHELNKINEDVLNNIELTRPFTPKRNINIPADKMKLKVSFFRKLKLVSKALYLTYKSSPRIKDIVYLCGLGLAVIVGAIIIL